MLRNHGFTGKLAKERVSMVKSEDWISAKMAKEMAEESVPFL